MNLNIVSIVFIKNMFDCEGVTLSSSDFIKKILGAFRRYSSEKYRLVNEANAFHVHELLSCKFKSQLRREIPELSKSVKSKIFIGESIDTFIRILVKNDEKIKEHLEDEKEVYTLELQVGNEKVKIVGKPDIVLKDEVIEIKYTSNTRGIPRKHHVEQLRFYLLLTGKEKGKLFYVTNEGYFEYDVSEPLTVDEAIRYYKNWTSPRYSWECLTCNFKEICPFYRGKRAKNGLNEV